MSRFPDTLEQAFRAHEAERRFARVEAVMERRRRQWELDHPLPPPIVDRDPGDEA